MVHEITSSYIRQPNSDFYTLREEELAGLRMENTKLPAKTSEVYVNRLLVYTAAMYKLCIYDFIVNFCV